MLTPLHVMNSGVQLIQQQSVSTLLKHIQSHPGPLAIPSPPETTDHIELMHPSLLTARSATPISAPPVSFSSPLQQLQYLATKYQVQSQGLSPEQLQTAVIQTILRVKAREYGIPESIALGLAGSESGWKMWSDLDKGIVIQGRNIREGILKSSDWGVMQINDKAHGSPAVFPRVKYDLEFNIDYGLRFLARQRRSIRGDLGLGLGDWDRTVASYNLGHDPRSARSLAIAQRYVSRVRAHSKV